MSTWVEENDKMTNLGKIMDEKKWEIGKIRESYKLDDVQIKSVQNQESQWMKWRGKKDENLKKVKILER